MQTLAQPPALSLQPLRGLVLALQLVLEPVLVPQLLLEQGGPQLVLEQ